MMRLKFIFVEIHLIRVRYRERAPKRKLRGGTPPGINAKVKLSLHVFL